MYPYSRENDYRDIMALVKYSGHFQFVFALKPLSPSTTNLCKCSFQDF